MFLRTRKLLQISVLLLCSAVQASAQGNPPEEMLKNSGFEQVTDGKISDWDVTAFAATSSKEHVVSGERSLKVSSARADFDPVATQKLRGIEQGKTYRLQYRVRAGKFNEQYRVYAGLWRETGKPEENKWVQGVDTQWRAGWDRWQQVSVDFTVTAPADFLVIVIEGKGPCTLWLDDISLKLATGEKTPDEGIAPLPPFVGSPKFVQIMPDRTFRVQGKPFFPIMLWGLQSDTEEIMAKAQDYGFNIVTPTHIDALGPEGFQLWLDTAHKYGLMVKATAYFGFSDDMVKQMLPLKLAAMKRVLEVGKDHPAMFGYTAADEPAWGGHNVRAFAAGASLIREIDPNHPILVNHAPRNSIADLAKYNRYADVGGSDIYPVWKTGLDSHSDLPNKTIGVVGDETTKNLRAVDNAKPVIETLQGFAWSDSSADPTLKDEPFPSAIQLRFMTYHSIVRGATGVAFFQDNRYQTIRPELKPIVREVNAMSDILAGGKTLQSKAVTDSPGVEVLAKEINGQLVLIALNSGSATTKARLNLTSLSRIKNGSLTVLQENRKVNLSDNIVTDAFEPYAVHIYTTAANDNQVLRAFNSKLKVSSVQKKTQAGAKAKPKVRPNLALTAEASGSSVYANFKYGSINDGNLDTIWNDSSQYAYPDWVTLEFPKPVAIDQIVVYSHMMTFFGYQVSDGIRDCEIQVQEGGDWKTVRTIKDSKVFKEVVELPIPITTTKVRIWVTATNGDQDFTRIGEVEVYGNLHSPVAAK